MEVRIISFSDKEPSFNPLFRKLGHHTSTEVTSIQENQVQNNTSNSEDWPRLRYGLRWFWPEGISTKVDHVDEPRKVLSLEHAFTGKQAEINPAKQDLRTKQACL